MKARKAVSLQSKWLKTKLLLQSASIRPYIPDTRKFTRRNLEQMIYSYGMIYVKPERGTYGNGVIRAERGERGGFTYQYEETVRHFDTFDSFHQSLAKKTGGRRYLIQKGIHLLKHNRRRFDIRVMVQLSPKGVWEATGIIGRLGHPRKIVTNYHSGGKPTAIETLLSTHLPAQKLTQLTGELSTLGVRMAAHMQKTYPKIVQIGVDVGLDRTLTPWIIEVNMNPDPYIFNQLKNKSMYKKVMRYRRYRMKK
ncbi:Endospore coat-associated protein YheD [Paenibacillus auburnensis]|uniref:Endospore coat-associated protein YheD n=1 Tax=Paenibacillus auburnensis TaxID=2905649 RepID=A0ABN8G3D7_9BACL|nr:YheC/YheD family protein [Paenibacillus auburnensis]CAH1195256.1 Endospore coat-associated protein YheD [Paenibacillus auburnensis]